ncbi:MAG: DegT/DnrJ/EryC1/StrS family aminotransferase [Verrucomicrobiaceae bacterium]|nr:DegT/DnrJ/EryC1/StrS family aminotransferase [Verrucomicrobiaceae bacterium]
MPVPLLDVNAQNHPLQDEFTAAFQRVLGHGMFIMGREVDELEAEIKAFLGAKYVLGVSSGTDALLLALMALDIGPGDEVICPTFTFFATGGCVSRVGATPVFVDVQESDFNIDLDAIKRKITPRTKAIMPVHLFGQSADMDGIMAIAAEHGLTVIEDAAQSFGARYKGQQSGTIGHFGAYSFFPSKNLGALGDAGLLVTNDDELGQRAKILRVHGMEPKYYHREVGGNFRIDALQSAFLRIKLRHYDSYTSRRQANAAWYRSKFGDSLKGKIVLPTEEEDRFHIWNQFTLRVLNGRRDEFRAHLAKAGIGCDIYYPLTLDQQECFQKLPQSSLDGISTAHRLASEVISIPIYPELREEQREEVAAAILSFV